MVRIYGCLYFMYYNSFVFSNVSFLEVMFLEVIKSYEDHEQRCYIFKRKDYSREGILSQYII